MRVAVCDDEEAERERFCEELGRFDSGLRAEMFADGGGLLEAAEKSPPFDVVFLDIYLSNENGIDVAKRLRELSPATAVVFVTTSRDHAVDAFSLYALHYLVKPVTKEGIAEAFHRLGESRLGRREQATFTVGADKRTVPLDRICLLENENHAVNVLLSDGASFKVWTPFQELERMMDGRFLKINRGLVVNMDFIEQMRTDTCVLRGGLRLPIAVRRSSAIRSAYDDYVFAKLSQRKGI